MSIVSAASPLEELEAAVKVSWAAVQAGQQSRAAHYRIVGWTIDARYSASMKSGKAKPKGWVTK